MDHLLAYMDCIPEIQHWGILENAFYSCHFFPSFCYYIELRLPDLAHTVYNNWTKFSFCNFFRIPPPPPHYTCGLPGQKWLSYKKKMLYY